MKFILPDSFIFVWHNIQQKLGAENLFFVGGFVRDTLLERPTKDLDLCCKLPPEQVHACFPDSLFFPRFGTVSFSLDSFSVTIASLRKESQYVDFRHPGKVTFVSTIQEDFPRRDFTINCLYVDEKMNILDPTGRGLRDLENKTLHLIGNAIDRLREDPLRILRAYRFSVELGFSFDEELKDALKECLPLVRELKQQKVKEEIRKCPASLREKMISELHLVLPDIV